MTMTQLAHADIFMDDQIQLFDVLQFNKKRSILQYKTEESPFHSA